MNRKRALWVWFNAAAKFGQKLSRGGSLVPAEIASDNIHHPVWLIKHAFILEADYVDAVFLKVLPSLAVTIAGGVGEVMFAVQFNGQFLRSTIEIQNVFPNAVLPSEFASVELRLFQHIPKFRLSGRQAGTQKGSNQYGCRVVV